METKKIIQIIAKNRFSKYVQALELACFIIAGYLVHSNFFEGSIMLIVGIFAAIIASESAIEEYKIKEGLKKSGSNRSS